MENFDNNNNHEELKREIKRFTSRKNTFLAVGISLAVIGIIGSIFSSVYGSMILTEAFDELETTGMTEQYDKAMDVYNILTTVGSLGSSLLITGGAALAIAGGIVNGVKAKNRRRLLKRRIVAEEYGGNGVEY